MSKYLIFFGFFNVFFNIFSIKKILYIIIKKIMFFDPIETLTISFMLIKYNYIYF